MFYAQFVLSKKGPLAKIWLAAHWEKKLSKAQVFETNVSDAVDEIMKPKVKMALRTTGHLLLGIVRIYARRSKYLLEDCNAAFLKISMSFKPGSGERRGDGDADGHALPEVMHDFDAAVPDFNDLDIPANPVQINQCRIDEITLKDDNGHGLAVSSSNHDHQLADGMDDFGECGTGIDFFDGVEPIDTERARRAASELSGIERSTEGVVLDSNDKLDVHMDAPLADDFGDFGNAEDLDNMFNADANGTMNGNGMPAESFQLEPLEVGSIVNEKVHRPRKRKRLMVDEVKNIGGDEMKANMADYEDICQPIDLAPPSKKLMHLRETANVERLFSQPGCQLITDPILIKIYQSHLVPKAKVLDDTAADDLRRDLDMIDNIDDVDNFVPPDDDFGDMEPMAEMPGSPIVFDNFEVDENVQPIADLPSPTKETEKRTRRPRHERAAEESEDDEDEHRCSKRTHAVASAINTRLKTHESITLNDLLTKGSTRKTAAQKFYALLELAKWQAIEVDQSEPYGDIVITEGTQMTALLNA